MAVKICCDFCENELPIISEKQGEVYVDGYELSYTKQINTSAIYPHLCKRCAGRIDDVVQIARDEWLKNIDISVHNARVNAARRELLGTKG